MVIHTRTHVFITRSVGNWGLWALRVITVVNCVLTVVNITVIYVFHTPKQIFRTSSIASITEFMNKQDKQYQSILSSIQSLKTNIEEHKKTKSSNIIPPKYTPQLLHTAAQDTNQCYLNKFKPVFFEYLNNTIKDCEVKLTEKNAELHSFLRNTVRKTTCYV